MALNEVMVDTPFAYNAPTGRARARNVACSAVPSGLAPKCSCSTRAPVNASNEST